MLLRLLTRLIETRDPLLLEQALRWLFGFVRPHGRAIAGLLGLSSAAWGSSLLLVALAPGARFALALAAALVLLAAVARTMRLRTLPR